MDTIEPMRGALPRSGSAPTLKRKMAAILSADVAFYSRLVAEDEEETLQRLADYRTVFDGFVTRYGGRIFNTAGDSVMSEFDSAVEAVRAAVDIQNTLRSRNVAFPAGRRLEFRMGLTVGDVVERNGDLLGDAVNVAARLQAIAPPGGICVSRTVHEAAASKVQVLFRDIGMQELKHIPSPVHAFMVTRPGERFTAPSPAKVRSDRRERSGGWVFWRRVRWIVVGLAIVFVVLPTLRLVRRAIEKEGGVTATEQVAPPRTSRDIRASGDATSGDPKAGSNLKASDAKSGTAGSGDQSGGETKAGARRSANRKPPLPSDPSAAFTQLARDPELIAQATTVPEVYHNARVLETKGDALGARRAYLTLARMPGEFIDPQLRLAALLRLQDGRAGAREVFTQLANGNPSKAVRLGLAQQLPSAERRTKLEAMVAEDGSYIPAWYVLAGAYGEDNGGLPTLTDRRLEYEALDRVVTADEEGKLAPFFLDQGMRAEWVDNARQRRGAIEARFSNAATRPTASYRSSDSGWLATIALPEPATGITYRLGDDGPTKQVTGQDSADTATRKPTRTATFTLPLDQPRTTIYVAYKDLSGGQAGPFPLQFDPREVLADNQRQVLELTAGSWLAWAADRGLVYFNHLIVYRCALKDAHIGFGTETPDMELPLPACDEAHPYAVPPDARVSITVPDNVNDVSVVLTFADGSQSEIKHFRRP